MRTELTNHLKTLDANTLPLASFHGEFLIADKIKEILGRDKTIDQTKDEIAEHIAFDFLEDYPDKDSAWGTYYGPQFVLPDENGVSKEYPSIRTVDEQILQYWMSRAKESMNPILRARYADLVVDFFPVVMDKRAPIDVFQIVVDSNILIVNSKLADPLDCITKIERSLNLALQNNDRLRIDRAKKTAIELHKFMAVNEKAGTWGFAFRWFLLDLKNKVKITDEEKEYLIHDMESRLEAIDFSPYLVESAVSLLAEYYADQRDEENLVRVLKQLEKSFKNDERSNSEPLLITGSYQLIFEIFEKYSRFPEVNEMTKQIRIEIGSLNLDWAKSMKTISVKTEIPREEIDNFIKYIFQNENVGTDLESVFVIFGFNFIPRNQIIKDAFQNSIKRSPTQFLATTQVISEDGIPVAILPPLNGDPDSHYAKHFREYIELDSFFLSLAMDELKSRFTLDSVLEYINTTVLFANENKEYLKRAMTAYWNYDFLLSSHLFIPLIETAIRELVRISGGVILTQNKIKGYSRVLLDSLLDNEPIFEKVFTGLGADVIYYFKLVLSHKLGLNLRNDFAHGFGKTKFFKRNASDRLFHILIVLSLVRDNKNEET